MNKIRKYIQTPDPSMTMIVRLPLMRIDAYYISCNIRDIIKCDVEVRIDGFQLYRMSVKEILRFARLAGVAYGDKTKLFPLLWDNDLTGYHHAEMVISNMKNGEYKFFHTFSN